MRERKRLKRRKIGIVGHAADAQRRVRAAEKHFRGLKRVNGILEHFGFEVDALQNNVLHLNLSGREARCGRMCSQTDNERSENCSGRM